MEASDRQHHIIWIRFILYLNMINNDFPKHLCDDLRLVLPYCSHMMLLRRCRQLQVLGLRTNLPGKDTSAQRAAKSPGHQWIS